MKGASKSRFILFLIMGIGVIALTVVFLYFHRTSQLREETDRDIQELLRNLAPMQVDSIYVYRYWGDQQAELSESEVSFLVGMLNHVEFGDELEEFPWRDGGDTRQFRIVLTDHTEFDFAADSPFYCIDYAGLQKAYEADTTVCQIWYRIIGELRDKYFDDK